MGGVLHAERVLKHVEGTDDICYDVLADKAKKSYQGECCLKKYNTLEIVG